MAMVKKGITVQSKESTEEKFAELLTLCAVSYVEKQLYEKRWQGLKTMVKTALFHLLLALL